MHVIVYDFSLFLLLLVHYVFINMHTVMWIYICCNNLYFNILHKNQRYGAEPAQRVDGNLRVQAPSF